MEIHSALRHDIETGEAEVVKLTRGQFLILETLKAQPRAAIVGPGGLWQDDARRGEGTSARSHGLTRRSLSASTSRWRRCSIASWLGRRPPEAGSMC